MIAKLKAAFASTTRWVNGWFTACMREPDVNSRMIFLGTFVVTTTLMIWHTYAYIHAPLKDGNYAEIMGVLGGTHTANAVGRFLTKKAAPGSAQADTNSTDDDSKG